MADDANLVIAGIAAMLVSHAWLREWVATDIGVHDLAARLTLGGWKWPRCNPPARRWCEVLT